MTCKECNRYFKSAHDLCYLAESDQVNGNTKACDNFEHYTPSSTNGDYSPSCPWNAPGMSIHDFI